MTNQFNPKRKNKMGNILELFGLLLPTIVCVIFFIAFIDMYLMIRKYLKLKIDYYTNKINSSK